VLVRFDHVARFIVNANHSIMRPTVKLRIGTQRETLRGSLPSSGIKKAGENGDWKAPHAAFRRKLPPESELRIGGRFLKKFEVFDNLASQFPEEGLKGKDTSERCRQVGTTCEKSSPFM